MNTPRPFPAAAADPLQRPQDPAEVPLRSPMPRSPILDREEPEPTDERDLPTPDTTADPAARPPAGEDDASRRQAAQSQDALDNNTQGFGQPRGSGPGRAAKP